MKTYKIHLLRHGITEANADGRYIGRTDLPLSPEGLAALLLKELSGLYPKELCSRYKLDNPNFDELQGWEILEMVGRKRGMLISGGEIDTERMAKILMDEFRGGKLGRFTLELPEQGE